MIRTGARQVAVGGALQLSDDAKALRATGGVRTGAGSAAAAVAAAATVVAAMAASAAAAAAAIAAAGFAVAAVDAVPTAALLGRCRAT
eukprot:363216-Chlamydomonas_euryale.AAC.1